MKTRHIASAALQIPFRHFDSTEREQQASKMRWGSVVVVLLVASFVSQSEAGLSLLTSVLKAAGSLVKEVATAAVGHVRKTCSNSTTGIMCSIFNGKRGVGNQDNAMDGDCVILGDGPALLRGLSFDVMKDTFEAVDSNGDGDDGDDVLDKAEFIEFLESLNLLNHCITKAAKDADNES
ncbi:uncharacterized protein [Littorina saxatilis]|uniref:uncharacterized protein isoform X1 n=1 Tax=Littorina saxatilis TaxID=31220 RepID=UPI0038B46A8C